MDKLRVGNFGNGSLGDMCFLSSLTRHFDLTVQLHNDIQSRDVSVIFDGIAKVEFVEKPPERIDKNCVLPIHRARKILISAGITDPYCVPRIEITEKEKQWAADYLKKYNKFAIFVNDNGGCSDKTNVRAQIVRPPIENIQFYVNEFSKLGYNCLQFGPNRELFNDRPCFTPFDNCIHIRDLTLRQTLACFSQSKILIGGDSGLYHTFLGAGNGKCCISIPNEIPGSYVYSDLLYSKECFGDEESRVYYLTHDKFIQNRQKIIDFLIK